MITDTLNWIHSYKANGRRPDKKRLLTLLSFMGNPQKQMPLIHVVGTNGKGSTTAYLQALFTTSGYRCGTFTSPYITHFNERIAIDGLPIADNDLEKLCKEIKPHLKNIERCYDRVTEFELITALMFAYFAKEKVDLAIVEAGIGGLHDATNCFIAQAVVCPSISFEHTEILGTSLAQIAKQKVGVLDDYVPLIFGNLPKEARDVFYDKAKELHSSTFELGQDFQLIRHQYSFDFLYHDLSLNHITLSMAGQHQQNNAGLAIMTSLILKKHFPKLNLYLYPKALSQVQVKGRTEWLLDNLVIDGAHNEGGIKSLRDWLASQYPNRSVAILFAGLRRKPLAKLLNLLSDYSVSVTSFSFYEAESLENYPKYYPRVTNFKEWFQKAQYNPNTLYVMTGSLYFISEIREYFFKSKKS
ncbi:bifunctional folylpolyglutamate synthase/dihydrofolate synthase [Streptococcus sciuri]|uniref:Bifunctional folylpolyglutamate synthase/dihydrofolate synthase n=1 Tax=Streptococcus sciuri TaxID=2973939 RepID=A0ABT2F851_9STRE|nr:folylpolyglutamate synthase/dihydrofolate synthase family protein [Streptococcus sciuri]MCS4488025.1 bifunctional folylpolyglutamate synthase/dihydrofolate synthase [Streptococcus sciuri]